MKGYSINNHRLTAHPVRMKKELALLRSSNRTINRAREGQRGRIIFGGKTPELN